MSTQNLGPIQEGESFFQKNNNLIHDHKLKQINCIDYRLYQRDENTFYPSVTTILTALPTDSFFLKWLEETGPNAEIIRNKSAKEGSQVHNAIEDLIKGKTVNWMDDYGNAKYALHVWQMILKFQDFCKNVKPQHLATELFLYSDKYRYAGSTDYLCQVGNETWLIDHKTSNHISVGYYCQLAAYAKALEETKGIKVDRCGILWLKASTRTFKMDLKKGICQGEGWQVKFVDDIDQWFKVFLLAYEMYKVFHGDKMEPLNKIYPTEISL